MIVPNEQAPIVKWAFERLATGKYSVEEVRRMCKEKGYPFCKNRFHAMFKMPMYCGRLIIPAYKNEEEQIVQGVHEPLITEEIFDRVQEVMAGKRFRYSYKVCNKEELPLRGFLNCPRCGRKLCGSGSRGGSGIKHFYYHCLKGCKERVKAPVVNEAFSKFIGKLRYKMGVNELFEKVMEHVFQGKTSDKVASRQAIHADIEKNKERLERAQQMMLDGELNMNEYKEIKATIEPKIEALLVEQMNLNHKEFDHRSYLKKGLNALKNIPLIFDRVDLTGKREIARSILKENAVYSDGEIRTTQLNSLIVLSSGFDGGMEGDEKEKGSLFSSPSRMVPRAGLEPACP